MKLLLVALHDTIGSVAGSSTMSYVLVRNGGGPGSCRPSIGLGAAAATYLLGLLFGTTVG